MTRRGTQASQHGRLFRKYVLVFAGLVTGTLLASGLLEVYFSYQENKQALLAFQHEKARGAASRIESFVKEIERQLGWTTQPHLVAPGAALEQRRIDSLRLLRQVPAITELSHLDPSGREQLRVSRLAMDVVGSGTDFSADPKFVEPKTGKTYFGPVYFRKESEPYMTIAMPQSGGGVTVAEVNLKFIWDVISQIKIGKAGRAYVVDSRGTLIAHPDISLVLQKTMLGGSGQVQAALAIPPPDAPREEAMIARDLQGRQVLTAYSVIQPLRWAVFVEQPLEEAFESLRASLQRTVALLLAGIVLSAIAGLLLARRMVQPIRQMQAGAAKIGAGELGHRIAVKTGDELEALADQFNRMTEQLQESYATLEQKVEERTRELSEALEQQTATAEILRVISSSPTDVRPVFEAIAESAAKVCGARDAVIHRIERGLFRRVAHFGAIPPSATGAEFPVTSATVAGRAVAARRTIQVPDILQPDARGEYPDSIAIQQSSGFRTLLVTPLLRDDKALGVIVISRTDVNPFSDKQVALLQTFANQAVIAIENVRLFQELQARTQELGRTVEQLTALGAVGQAVSSTLDLARVLPTIADHAGQLSGADGAEIYEYDEHTEVFHLRASRNFPNELVQVLRATPVRKGQGALGRTAVTREPVQFADIAAEGGYTGPLRDALLRAGFRAVLAVPLLREDHFVGGLVVHRNTPGEFSAETVELLKTFGTQSALAIQNARLFREIEDKSRQLEIANRHKSEFLANMSHELRTPLNAVIGFSEVLLERMFGEINEKQEEYLRDIYASGRHLLSLINDILDLSKVEAGRMELELTTFNMPMAIDNAITLVKTRAENHGLALETAIDERLGDFVGDERKFKQILVNLLSNAVKFTPAGGRVVVRAAPSNGTVEVAVTDTGIGIAPEDQEAIFEEFRQVGAEHAGKREGTGLGLTLTRKFIELHGGKIWVKSAPGKGSTFAFTLPVRPWPTS